MTTFRIDAQNGSDVSGDGLSLATAWQTLAKLRAQTGDDHVFHLYGDFRDQTPGTNGCIEAGGHNWTTILEDVLGVASIVGFNRGSPINLTSVNVAAGTCTVQTATPHGLATSATILIAGLLVATTANGYQKITVTGASTFTFALAGTTSESSAGTMIAEARSSSAYYNSGFNGCTLQGGKLSRCLYGVRLMGTIAGHLMYNVDTEDMGAYAHSCGGASTGVIVRGGHHARLREDIFNFSGSSNEGFICEDFTWERAGYSMDGTTASTLAGAGDVVTTHPGSGNSNYGTVRRSSGAYALQGFATFTNTAGLSMVYDNMVEEVSGSGIVQNGGGSMIALNNSGIAPVLAALDATSVHSFLRFNPANGVAGYFLAVGNSFYSARGSISPVSGGYFALSVAGDTGISVFKNNRFLSNGTAPFAHIATKTAVSISSVTIGGSETTVVTSAPHLLITGDKTSILSVAGTATAANKTWTVTVIDPTTYTIPLTGSGSDSGHGTSNKVPYVTLDRNGYSGANSVTLFSYSGSKTLATMQTHGWEANGVSGVSVETVPPLVLADFGLTDLSGGLDAGEDLTGLGVPELLVDADGHARGAAPDLGAFELVTAGAPGGLSLSEFQLTI